jgi:biopolymer transport protein ExbB
MHPRPHRLIAALIAACLLIFAAAPASAWWDGKWKCRKKIVLDATPQGGDVKEALTDFPLLVRLHTGDFSFDNAKPDGSDVRFVASDDKTPLKYHIEQYDAKQETALVWVKVPAIAPGSHEGFFYVYYGNSAAASGDEPGGVFDVPQLVDYHFMEKEGLPRDSTSYKNNAKECTAKLGLPSPLGMGVSFKTATDHITIPSLALTKGFTFSAWARISGSGKLLSWEDPKQSAVVAIEGTKLSVSLNKKNVASTDVPLGKWVHIAISAEAGKDLAIYIDGKPRATAKISSLPSPSSDIIVGGFAGDLDELGLANTTRSASWVQTLAGSQGPDSTLLAFQDEETSSGGGENLTVHLLVVTARAITLDGWLIIGCIIAMIAITWILFVNKFALVRRLRKDNRAFFESFSASEETFALKEADFPDSSLFRVYLAGLDELERRKKQLTSRGMNAFKAILEKAALEESKRNTAGLLMFTLSISGGPFMGLFGTVWGVINTFAGVAEAGEANLAAIAPGVASALACTLMGLMLAIPALFQYSFLSGEIRNLSADMGVFMDEFANRVEEEFGEKR